MINCCETPKFVGLRRIKMSFIEFCQYRGELLVSFGCFWPIFFKWVTAHYFFQEGKELGSETNLF